jgi:hypothetical protein
VNSTNGDSEEVRNEKELLTLGLPDDLVEGTKPNIDGTKKQGTDDPENKETGQGMNPALCS